jgi:SAM-dependent methyltransferase
MGLGSSINRLGGAAIRSYVRSIEEWRFDTSRHVQTAGNVKLRDAGPLVGEIRDSLMYGPVRAANAHTALRDLPCGDLSEYTFIDVGSGKGRMLFVAAEYPFRKVAGVEFSKDLHEQALTNIGTYKHRRQRCGDIESILANAATFEFPDEKLVIYMFNPFGPEIMREMLANLERSLEKSPRHVVVVMLWPERADMVAGMPLMKKYRETRRYHVYQTVK